MNKENSGINKSPVIEMRQPGKKDILQNKVHDHKQGDEHDDDDDHDHGSEVTLDKPQWLEPWNLLAALLILAVLQFRLI